MQSGGSDPAIVAQMIELQAEAQSLEKNQPATAGKAKKKSKSDDELNNSVNTAVLSGEN